MSIVKMAVKDEIVVCRNVIRGMGTYPYPARYYVNTTKEVIYISDPKSSTTIPIEPTSKDHLSILRVASGYKFKEPALYEAWIRTGRICNPVGAEVTSDDIREEVEDTRRYPSAMDIVKYRTDCIYGGEVRELSNGTYISHRVVPSYELPSLSEKDEPVEVFYRDSSSDRCDLYRNNGAGWIKCTRVIKMDEGIVIVYKGSELVVTIVLDSPESGALLKKHGLIKRDRNDSITIEMELGITEKEHIKTAELEDSISKLTKDIEKLKSVNRKAEDKIEDLQRTIRKQNEEMDKKDTKFYKLDKSIATIREKHDTALTKLGEELVEGDEYVDSLLAEKKSLNKRIREMAKAYVECGEYLNQADRTLRNTISATDDLKRDLAIAIAQGEYYLESLKYSDTSLSKQNAIGETKRKMDKAGLDVKYKDKLTSSNIATVFAKMASLIK